MYVEKTDIISCYILAELITVIVASGVLVGVNPFLFTTPKRPVTRLYGRYCTGPIVVGNFYCCL